MRIVCKEQHTHEWHQARCGICTASAAKLFMSRLSRKSNGRDKGEYAQSHWDYVTDLAWEKILGQPTDHYVSKPMEIGTQYEGEARIEYWMRFLGGDPANDVQETGFVLHPRLDYLGASPDGLVGTDGGVEIKIPVIDNHKAILRDNAIPQQWLLQMYTNMLCCERSWWDFVSYCPPDICLEMPDEFRLFRKRLEADQDVFDAIEQAATDTMEHVAQEMVKLRRMYPSKEAPRSKFVVELEQSVLAKEISDTADPDDFSGPAYNFLDRAEVMP